MTNDAEKRYPRPGTEVRTIIFGFPVVVAASFLAQAKAEYWWWLLAFCAVGWIGATGKALADVFRREGYEEGRRNVVTGGAPCDGPNQK